MHASKTNNHIRTRGLHFRTSIIHVVLFAAITLISIHNNARSEIQDIAICGPTTGWAYYNHSGLLQKKGAGWQKDVIPNGKTVIKQLDGSVIGRQKY